VHANPPLCHKPFVAQMVTNALPPSSDTEDFDLEPSSGNVTEDCTILSRDNQPLAHDTKLKLGCEVKMLAIVDSLFFESDNLCRLSTEVSNVQTREEGEDTVDVDFVDEFMFN